MFNQTRSYRPALTEEQCELLGLEPQQDSGEARRYARSLARLMFLFAAAWFVGCGLMFLPTNVFAWML